MVHMQQTHACFIYWAVLHVLYIISKTARPLPDPSRIIRTLLRSFIRTKLRDAELHKECQGFRNSWCSFTRFVDCQECVLPLPAGSYMFARFELVAEDT